MRALITGGAGFIGSHLADALIARGDSVIVLDDLSTGRRENGAHLQDHPEYTFHLGTILDAAHVQAVMSECDVVFHLAAAVGVKHVIDNPLQSLITNIRGTETVLEAANYYKRRAIIASTSEVYGKNESDSLSEETNRIMGPTQISRWGYAATKAVDEFLSLAYYREKQLPLSIARLFNTVGPRQIGTYGMVIPRFVNAALLGHTLQIFGDGQQRRCFAYVGDVIDGLLAIAETSAALGEVFNLGNTEEISIEALARKIIDLTGSASQVEFIPYEAAYEEGFQDMRRRVPDISKARRLLGYEPAVGLDELLQLIIAHFRK